MYKADLHCDTISRLIDRGESLYENTGHFDLVRAQRAGVNLQVFAIFLHPADQLSALKGVLKQVDYYYQQLDLYSDYVYPLISPDAYCDSESKVAALLHLEGAEALGEDLEILRVLYRLGLRSIGLTWNHRNLLADGVGEGKHAHGLSRAGVKMIKEINNLGMMLDLSHLAPAGFYHAIETSVKPVLVTHANARALCDHPRNLDDDQLLTLAEAGGMIGLNQVNDFVCIDSVPTLDNFLDHAVYIAEKIGVQHIALGSDFDGADHIVLPGVEAYEQLDEAMVKRGFSATETEMILNRNYVRLMKEIMN